MKITAFVMLILFTIGVKGADLVKIRAAFYRAAHDENEARNFLQTMESIQDETPLMTGYSGMAYFLMSRFEINPFTKLENFRKGRSLLEKAITSDSTDIELRFLRLTVQRALPAILDYSENVAEDEDFVKRRVMTLMDADLKARIMNYLNNNK